MIKQIEVRIGNTIQDIAGIEKELTVCGIDNNAITCGCPDFTYPYLPSHLAGVPLTPELLEAYGFEKTGFNSYILLLPYSYSCSKRILSFSGDYLYLKELTQGKEAPDNDVICLWNKDLMKVFYLHQLENLFYALTGTELTKKLKN